VIRTADEELAVIYDGGARLQDYDPRLDLLWVATQDTLEVVDLRKPVPKATIIATDVPDVPISIIGTYNGSLGMGAPEIVELDWSKTPSTKMDLTFGEVLNEDQAAAIKKVKIVGGEWLIAELDRTSRDLTSKTPEKRRVKVPIHYCEDGGDCGQAVAFGASGWDLYVAQYGCGDYCYYQCLLHDPKTKKVAEVTLPPKWVDKIEQPESECGPYIFSEDGKTYATDDKLCTVGGECKDIGGTVIGTLQPATTINLGGS